MIQRLKLKLLHYALRHLFPIVDLEQVLTSDRQGNLYLNKVRVDPQKLQDLKQEAHLFRNTKLWEIMHHTLKHQAQQIMFTNSQTTQDVLNGKMILYTLDVQHKIVEKIDVAK